MVVAPGARDAVLLRRVRTRKHRRDLVAFVEGAPITPRLKSRRITGTRGRKVLGKLGARGRGKPDRS